MLHPTTNTTTATMRESKIIRTVHLECLKNHAVHLGHHVLDGCAQFCPQNFLPDRCAACGCHRGFHRPYPIFDVLHHDDENHSATPAVPNGGGSDGTAAATSTTTHDAACMGSERFPSPPLRGAEGSKLMRERVLRSELLRERFPSPPPGFQEAERAGGSWLTSTLKRRKMKSKFTVKQKAAMRWLAGRLKWCLRNEQEKGEIKRVCDKIGVTRTMFRNWVYNNKRPTRKPSNVIVLSP